MEYHTMVLDNAEKINDNDLMEVPMTYDRETLCNRWDEAISRADVLIDEVRDVTSELSPEVRIEQYDTALSILSTGAALASLMSAVHPKETVRTVAEDYEQRFASVTSSLAVDRRLYDTLAGVDRTALSDDARRFLEEDLEDFERGGVTRDEATRQRIKALSDEITELGIEFERNIREGRRTMEVSFEGLAGLPESFVSARRTDDGLVTLSTDYTDRLPVAMYCTVRETRRSLAKLSGNLAFPENMPVFQQLLEKRGELATLLGYTNWADYVTNDKMAECGDTVSAFIADVVGVSQPFVAQECDAFLGSLLEVNPEVTTLESYDWQLARQRLAARKCDFDPAVVRMYFHYDRVRDGVIAAAEGLFDVNISRQERTTWHPSVETYEVYDRDGMPIGRFCLDMHPRKGKYNHAAAFPMTQVAIGRGEQLPEVCLVCNFADPLKGDGLMEHSDVVTFFHEFGHLMHHILGSQVRFASEAGFNCEWDFVETPSQVFEAWAWDPGVLSKFARHHETGEPIPDALVTKMNEADRLGRAMSTMRQMYLASVSLALHQRGTNGLDPDQVVKGIAEMISPFPHDEETHLVTNFGHLNGYSAIYYTYMWSFVCALEVLSIFRERGMNDPEVSQRYVREIISKGGSISAAEMMQSFLGRDWSTDVLASWVRGEI